MRQLIPWSFQCQVLDLTDEYSRDDDSAAALPSDGNPGPGGAVEESSGLVKVAVGERIFHLLGVYDGHRSNHAARYCAEALGAELAWRLGPALRPMPAAARQAASAAAVSASEGGGLAAEEEAASAEEEAASAEEQAAVCEALAAAVVSVDAAFCRRRYASLIRDNAKKFYVTTAEAVGPDFDLDAWDASPLEREWRRGLQASAAGLAARRGLAAADGEAFAHQQQARWSCYKKELFPGAALCAVLVDAHRGKLFCANAGDCAAMLFVPGAGGAAATAAADEGTVGKFGVGLHGEVRSVIERALPPSACWALRAPALPRSTTDRGEGGGGGH